MEIGLDSGQSRAARYFESVGTLFSKVKQLQELRYKDCSDVLCAKRDQKQYTVLARLPRVLTFNLALGDGDSSSERLLDLLMLLPNVLDPFTLFKRRASQS